MKSISGISLVNVKRILRFKNFDKKILFTSTLVSVLLLPNIDLSRPIIRIILFKKAKFAPPFSKKQDSAVGKHGIVWKSSTATPYGATVQRNFGVGWLNRERGMQLAAKYLLFFIKLHHQNSPMIQPTRHWSFLVICITKNSDHELDNYSSKFQVKYSK